MPADRVLTEMSSLGITATEFGPDGFLPEDPTAKAAFLEGNLDAVKFIYKHRIQKDEERFAERIYAIEDRVQEEVLSAVDQAEAEDELKAAEARLEHH